ncbi:MAG TPA: EamA family transporter RarD [Anaerolineales bacterium]|nr:EamA family transporter RarD [Anaerolineales bacterium]
MRKGYWLALASYLIWGCFPIYFKLLKTVPPLQTLTHRMVWSAVFLLVLQLFTTKLGWLSQALRSPRVLGVYLVSALLLSVNWLVFIVAINRGYVVESSLGYFINPLVNVFLGYVVLREKLTRWQWLAIGLCVLGVSYRAIAYGQFPWVALALAGSFGTYGFVRKIAPLDSLRGLTIETLFQFFPALLYLGFVEWQGVGAFGSASLGGKLLLMSAGIVTAVPLLLYAAAMRRLPLTTMGILLYINPTLQFLSAVLLFKEPFSASSAIGFGMIWVALLIFTISTWQANRSQTRQALPT